MQAPARGVGGLSNTMILLGMSVMAVAMAVVTAVEVSVARAWVLPAMTVAGGLLALFGTAAA